MQTSNVADVIIFTKNDALKKRISDHAKMKGVSNIVQCSTAAEAIDAVKRFAKGFLVIDWSADVQQCTRILTANRQVPDGTTRPMLIISADVNENLVTTAAEYGVSQIFFENDNPKELTNKISQLMVTANLSNDYKTTMQAVVKLRSKGKNQEALSKLLALYKKTPNDLRVTSELGDCLMAVGNWEQAAQVLNPMKETKPPYLRGIHLYGRCLMHQGNLKEAYAILKSANFFNPNDSERLCDLGNVLMQMDKLKEASSHFEKALEINPEYQEAQKGLSQVKLLSGQVNDALAMMKNITNQREMASMFNISAVMSMRQGRFESGLKLYMAAVKTLGNNKKIHSRLLFNMGVGYRRWQKPDLAKACFEEALVLDPTYEKAQKHKDIVEGLDVSDIASPNETQEITDKEMAAVTKLNDQLSDEDIKSMDFDINYGDLDDEDINEDDLEEEGITYKYSLL